MLFSGDYEAVLDACVLVPPSLCNLLLKLAETPRLYLPRWSGAILTEVTSNQVKKLGWPEDLSQYWRSEVEKHFPEAAVTEYESYIDSCANDVKDGHVLAAAIRCKADSIVTFNLKDFRKDALEPWSIEAVHPSTFLSSLYELSQAVVMAKVDDIAYERRCERRQVLKTLSRPVPGFALQVASDLGLDL